ncbi:BrnA antitoxin family protein [Magnetospira sp. QH-2]|uniref:BrnA antitoxin family protein n=1 Tax=Magnetospira sp. (strain QH-2) TaxID=1288970 RepID=UPI0009E4FFE1|nr:BrnA antitoxin family protein [Magnetospira sp. QH-2]
MPLPITAGKPLPSHNSGAGAESDPDEIPELTEDWFAEAHVMEGKKRIRRGRPPAERTKQAISIRVSPEVLDFFKTEGPGWQTRIDDVLRAYVKSH